MMFRRHRRTRASMMLEFVLLMPLILFFLVFTLNISHAVMMRTQLQVAADMAARAGAQVGGGIIARATVSEDAFIDYLCGVPGYDCETEVRDGDGIVVNVNPGTYIKSCTAETLDVVVEAEVEVPPLLPGMGYLLALTTPAGGSPTPNWDMVVRSAARCEVVRQ